MKLKSTEGSQSKILHSYIFKCNYVFIMGLILFLILLFTNHLVANTTTEQIENVYYLNQFRNGSKTLTLAVTSYIASGKQGYRDDYNRELYETKSRDDAIEKLKANNLKKEEIDELERIFRLSNDLLPSEKTVLEMAESGSLNDAKSMIFSSFYKATVDDINRTTDALIDQIVNRMEGIVTIVRIVQIVIELLFAGTLLWLTVTIVVTIRYAREEILKPVVKVSDQLMVMAQGDLHQKLELKEDDSEVGKMATAIREMKQNWSDMIYEIAYSLEEMSRGNYVLEFTTEYVGEFVTIKECLIEIVDGMKNIIQTISDASKDIDNGASGLTQASEALASACSNQVIQLSDILIYLQGITEKTRANEKDAEEAVKISQLVRSTVDLEETRVNKLNDTLNEIAHCIEEMSAIVELTSMSEDTQTLVENTMRKLNDILESTNEAFNELEDMKVGTEETTQRSERIVNNFKQEIEDIDKITENLASLAGLVDNNSATAEETAAISVQQKSQVTNLVALIDNFNI